MSNIIGEIISSRRKEIGFSLEDVAKIVGVNKGTISKWEKGVIKSIKSDKIELLSRALAIDVKELVVNSVIPSDCYRVDLMENSIPVAVLKSPPATFTNSLENKVIDFENATKSELLPDKDYYYLEINDHSMEPFFLLGDLILISFGEEIKSGDFAVLSVDDDEKTLVRKIKILEDETILQCENPFFPPVSFKGTERFRLKFFGKIVQSKRSFS